MEVATVRLALFLIISSIPEVIANPNGALACFVIALVIMGLG